jgi:NADH dehydrogenase
MDWLMVLVTGSTGFIGRSLANQLTEAGKAWRPYTGRINAPLALREQLYGIETVIHLAGSEARGRDRLLLHVDVEGMERLVEECRRAGVGRLIVPSRIGADPHSSHPLLRAKGEVERVVVRSGIDYTILRTATLFGRGDRFTEIILGLALWSWPLVWVPGGGRAATQPLWVEDYVRCLVASLERPDLRNRTIVLAGAERFSYREIVGYVLATAGVRRLRFPIPLLLARWSSRMTMSWWYWPAASPYFLDRFVVPEVAPVDSVRDHFGFYPARLAETITYLNRPGLRWRVFRR